MVIHKFFVQGQGHFPIDMLRYDACFPASEHDSALIYETFEYKTLDENIELHNYDDSKDRVPRNAR
jgi:hypothetical protein